MFLFHFLRKSKMSFEEIFNNMESTIDSNNIQEEIIYLDNFLPASEVLNEEHVITGYEVTEEKLEKLSKLDRVKICNGPEFFWTEIDTINNDTIIGIVSNDLYKSEYKKGDKVEFHKSNVYEVHLKEDFENLKSQYEIVKIRFSNYFKYKSKNGPLEVEDDDEIYLYFNYFTNIQNILKNENKNIDNYESLKDYYSEIDNLFMKVYEINFDSMIQQNNE